MRVVVILTNRLIRTLQKRLKAPGSKKELLVPLDLLVDLEEAIDVLRSVTYLPTATAKKKPLKKAPKRKVVKRKATTAKRGKR